MAHGKEMPALPPSSPLTSPLSSWVQICAGFLGIWQPYSYCNHSIANLKRTELQRRDSISAILLPFSDVTLCKILLVQLATRGFSSFATFIFLPIPN